MRESTRFRQTRKAGDDIKSNLSVTATPQVNTEQIAAAVKMSKELRDHLAAIGTLSAGIGAQMRAFTTSIPTPGKAQRANFSTGGVKGE